MFLKKEGVSSQVECHRDSLNHKLWMRGGGGEFAFLGPALAIMQSKVYMIINNIKINISLPNTRDFHNWKGETVEVSSRLP